MVAAPVLHCCSRGHRPERRCVGARVCACACACMRVHACVYVCVMGGGAPPTPRLRFPQPLVAHPAAGPSAHRSHPTASLLTTRLAPHPASRPRRPARRLPAVQGTRGPAGHVIDANQCRSMYCKRPPLPLWYATAWPVAGPATTLHCCSQASRPSRRWWPCRAAAASTSCAWASSTRWAVRSVVGWSVGWLGGWPVSGLSVDWLVG